MTRVAPAFRLNGGDREHDCNDEEGDQLQESGNHDGQESFPRFVRGEELR